MCGSGEADAGNAHDFSASGLERWFPYYHYGSVFERPSAGPWTTDEYRKLVIAACWGDDTELAAVATSLFGGWYEDWILDNTVQAAFRKSLRRLAPLFFRDLPQP